MKDLNDVFAKRYQLINDRCRKVGVTKGVAVEVNGRQAGKAFKEQIERKGGMPYKPGPNHPWKRFIVNHKYKPRELGKKGVSDDRAVSKSRVNNTQIFEKVYLTLFKVFDS